MKHFLFAVLAAALGVSAAHGQIAAPKYSTSNANQVALSGTTSALTTVTSSTSTTQITLSASTVETTIIPATTGTTFYRLGAFTVSATNAIPLVAGQLVITNVPEPGSKLSISGSGAMVFEAKR